MSNLDLSQLSPADLAEALEGPALRPPEGVTPNFDDPPNLDAIALAAVLGCLILASTFLFIRIYIKFVKLKQWHAGDYLMILSYPFYLALVVGTLRCIDSPLSLFIHQWNIRGQDMKDYLFHIFIGTNFGLIAILLVKSSILLEWIKLFASTSRQPFALSCKILIAVNITCYIGALLTLNLSCQPFQKIWDKTIEGTCIDIRKLYLGTAVINLTLDLAILLLPQPVIWSLQMTKSRKIGVSAVFLCGVLAIIAAGFLIGSVVSWIRTADMTYYYSAVALWSIAEATCGIMIFSVPFAPRFFREVSLAKEDMNASRLPSSSTHRREWPEEFNAVQRLSKAHDYLEIDDRRSSHLRAYGGAPRPTDRQYGIAVTTDIVVTETYETNLLPINDRRTTWVRTV